MERLLLFRKAMFAGEFSSRALKLGRAYSMEIYVFNVSVEAHDIAGSTARSVVVSATCFAFYRKKKNRKHAPYKFLLHPLLSAELDLNPATSGA